MEVQPVPFEVQPLFYRNKNDYNCEVSFDGKKFYTFKKANVEPLWWTKKFDYIILYTENEVIRCDGYYDKDSKTLHFFYNRKINKLYKSLVRYQELERSKQTFLIPDEEIRKKQKMSMKDLEDLKSGRVELEDAPRYIQPTSIESEQKEDKDEKMCLYLHFKYMEEEDEMTVTQKYTPFHIAQLVKRMKLMKIKDCTKWLTPNQWKMEQEVFKGVGFPKYLPVQSED